MLLALDIANVHIVIGLFDGEQLVGHWTIATRAERTTDEYFVLIDSLFQMGGHRLSEVTGVVVASVVPPLTGTFQKIGEELGCAPIIVGPGTRTGVRLRIENPRELGPDRIANALAAIRLYGPPAIVVDFATATTFDAIAANGDYLGVAIAPGIDIAAEALFRQTSQLLLVELVPPPSPIGRNTVHSIQSGLVYGYVGLVEGMVARLKAEVGPNAHVIATGDRAALVAAQTDVLQIVDPNLTLTGLRMIWEMNRMT
jgi:type III pantothenate kinase